MTLGSPEHRARIVRCMELKRDDVRQIFIDVEHWNAQHPHEQPIDPDPDGALRRLLDGLEFSLACEASKGGVGPIEPIDFVAPDGTKKREEH
jgi:hypothetical protein